MNREMYVSSTPHETKVAIVEDDQLAEVFFERENEYTLAGSIYKGRVTRVLPGMQSAFVDIGLERDAFLYVSDFLELADEDEYEELPVSRPEVYVTNRPPQEPRHYDLKPREITEAPLKMDEEAAEEPAEGNTQEYAEAESPAEVVRESGEGERPFRAGRRRRRGRRGRGFPESKFATPSGQEEGSRPAPDAEGSTAGELQSGPPPRRDFGPPPGYQPIILPGESISKYQRASTSETQAEHLAEFQGEGPADIPEAEPSPLMPVEDVAPPEPPPIPTSPAPTSAGSRIGPVPVTLPSESIAKYRRSEAQPEATPMQEVAPEQPTQQQAPVYTRREPRPVEERGSRGTAPVVLPGESIAKYRRLGEKPAEGRAVEPAQPAAQSEQALGRNATFVIESETFGEAAEPAPPQESHTPAQREAHTVEPPEAEKGEPSHEERFEQMNVAAVFGGPVAERDADKQEPTLPSQSEFSNLEPQSGFPAEHGPGSHGEPETHRIPEPPALEHPRHEPAFTAAGQSLEHEEIEGEEEAELHPDPREMAGEDEEEDQIELEEETLEPGGRRHARAEESEAADAEEKIFAEGLAESVEEAKIEEDAMESAYEEEATDEEMEFEEEELVGEDFEPVEGVEEPEVGRAELRAPSGTARYQQRAVRPPADRFRRQRGGRRNNVRPRRHELRQDIKISDLLKEGQEVLIQIAKEPIGKKGARITSHIALPGRFLVYMPTVNHIGVSRKITSDDERLRLKRIMISEREGGHGGFIVRTAAEGITEDELRADIRFLKNLWSGIKSRAESSKAPALIYHDLNLVERILRDQVNHDFAQVWVDTEQEYERILRFANRFQPSLVRKVKLYTKETPLFEQFNIQEEINKALKSKVWLKSGGYIVINQTEALVAIDVNTGKYVGKTARLEDTIVKTNIDAIKEIVRQIRLRDLGGIIVIDFIDMDERRNRQKVMQALEEALKADRSPSKVLAFNDFGLVAITRKRVKQSLERTLGQPCSYCGGTGLVKSVNTICNEIYTELRKMVRHLEEREDIMLRVNPEVAKALKADGGRWLQDLEELTRRTVIVKSDALLHAEQFDIH